MANNSNNTPSDPLSKTFGLEPLNGRLKPNGKVIIPDPTDDYEYNRQEIIDVLEKAKQYMQAFGEVALSAQEPRHFEVLNTMISTIIDGHQKLMDIKQVDQNMKAKELKDDPNITNNLYVGSTNDLLEIMHQKMKKKKNDSETEE